LYRHRPFDRVDWFAVAAINGVAAGVRAQLAPIGPGI